MERAVAGCVTDNRDWAADQGIRVTAGRGEMDTPAATDALRFAPADWTENFELADSRRLARV